MEHLYTRPEKEMSEDSMRDSLSVKMYCSKHPKTLLNFSTDSKIGASSAYFIDAKILIHPCSKCESEMNEIKAAIKLFNSIKD